MYYLIRNNRIYSVLVSAKAAVIVIVIPANKMQGRFQNYYSYVFLSSSVDGKVD